MMPEKEPEKENKKIAVVLFNLGGPDSRKSIKPFLFNFFMDKNIVRAPLFIRYFLAKFISIRRSKREAGSSYGELGYKSPLLKNSSEQAKALEKLLNAKETGTFKTFVSMRYWHPRANEVSKQVKAWGPDELILLPLYPQFSTTTTRSSFQEWQKVCVKNKLDQPTTIICCYPWEKGFVAASAQNLKMVYEKALKETVLKNMKAPRILFSAHGLPEKIIQDGDPYQWQCEQSAEHIAKATGIENLDWQICYQSRVGRLKWIGPSTKAALQKAVQDNVPVVILPHAFTQENVETLVEIDIEYYEFSKQIGLNDFYRVPTVGTSAAFIDGLADQVTKHMGKLKTVSQSGEALCPSEFKQCCIRQTQGLG